MDALSWIHPGLPIAIVFLVAYTTISPSRHSLSPLIRCTFFAWNGKKIVPSHSAGHSDEIPFVASWRWIV
jgi:hypothetical protein